MKKTSKKTEQIVIKEYGSINKFLDEATIKLKGRLPLSRAYLYKLIKHLIPNPGIKTLNVLASLTNQSKEDLYKEYGDE